MQTTSSLEKTLMLGKIEGKRRRGQQRMRWLDSTTDSMDMNSNTLWEIVKVREAWSAVVHGIERVRHNLATEAQRRYGQAAMSSDPALVMGKLEGPKKRCVTRALRPLCIFN